MVRSIAIVSLEEGSGKTTLALNLGLALQLLGHRVVVYDADFTKDNMVEHLGIDQIPTHLGHVFSGDAHINDATYRHMSGMKIIPSMIHNYDKFSYHYQDLLGTYDYIILDTPLDMENLELVLKSADEAVILHSPGYSSKNVSDAMELLSRLKILNLGIVLNRFSDGSVDRMFGYPVLVNIPKHKDVEESFMMKNPVVHTHPASAVTKRFVLLAKRFE